MKTDSDRIWADVAWLAAEPRPAESDRLEECRRYCENQLADAGWQVQRVAFSAEDSDAASLRGINLVCDHSHQAADRPTFVVGAHVDSCEETPGADDNASAVAVLLEVARQFPQLLAEAETPPIANLQLVVFDLEEHGMLGGAFHAASCKAAGVDLVGMVSLEMLGYCSHQPGSQTFPPELADRYPDVGNFIGVVGNQISEALIQKFVAGFRQVPALPVEFLQVPDNGRTFPPTRLSDHSPFWDEGFPALMITDTSFMRNPHYHQPSDTIDTLDQEFLHRVAEGVLNGIRNVVFDS